MASGTMTAPASVSTGTLTKAHSNITNVERAGYKKYGNVVVLDLTFTVGTVISDNTATLFTGLPKAVANQRFRAPRGDSASYTDLVLAATIEGTIVNQWSTGGIGAGQYQTECTYICQ